MDCFHFHFLFVYKLLKQKFLRSMILTEENLLRLNKFSYFFFRTKFTNNSFKSLSNCQDLLSWYFSTLSIIIHAICLILREKIIIMWRNDLKMIMTNPVSKKKISLFFGGAKNILIRLNFKWIGCMLHGLKKKGNFYKYLFFFCNLYKFI